jgi:hypothetical protein
MDYKTKYIKTLKKGETGFNRQRSNQFCFIYDQSKDVYDTTDMSVDELNGLKDWYISDTFEIEKTIGNSVYLTKL